MEHVIPKSVARDLETEWSNLLLGCVNCNGCKSNRNHSRDGHLWPDRDNTFGAFVYQSSGDVFVNETLVEEERSKASALFDLVGLGRQNTSTNERNHLRREAWGTAALARGLARDGNSRQLVVELALVFCPGNTFTEPCGLGQDGFSSGDPCKGASLGIDLFYKTVDFADQFLEVGEGATSNCLLANQSKPAFHLIDPGCVSGSVMHVKTRTGSKPLLQLSMVMGTVIVHNKVDVKKLRHVPFNMF